MSAPLSSLGWVQISRRAVDQARRALDGGGQGILDEVGFLALHRGYADRFFPGTSVLHTRLRYVLFVAWLLDDLLQGAHGGNVPRAERWLLGKLVGAGNGVIGGDVFTTADRLPRQLPHEVYWSALGTWGVLLPTPDGTLPRRRTVLTRARVRSRVSDDDNAPLDTVQGVLRGLPQRPAGWRGSTRLGFELESEDERVWLAERLSSTRFRGRPTVLSALVEHEVEVRGLRDMFAVPVHELLHPDDLEALERARRAAHLAAIGRAIYAALVERMWVADGNGHSTSFAESLSGWRDSAAAEALGVTPEQLAEDVGGLPSQFVALMGHVQAWLRSASTDVADLHEVFATEEKRKKGNRARLAPSTGGRQRRAAWHPDKHPDPTPLHYRWSTVQQLLVDLRTGP